MHIPKKIGGMITNTLKQPSIIEILATLEFTQHNPIRKPILVLFHILCFFIKIASLFPRILQSSIRTTQRLRSFERGKIVYL